MTARETCRELRISREVNMNFLHRFSLMGMLFAILLAVLAGPVSGIVLNLLIVIFVIFAIIFLVAPNEEDGS